jgi:hypothetical protein
VNLCCILGIKSKETVERVNAYRRNQPREACGPSL